MNKCGVIVYDKDGAVIGEYESIHECASDLGMGDTAVFNRLKGRNKKDRRRFVYAERKPVPPRPIRQPRPRRIAVRGECREMPYETVDGVICVTDCRFKVGFKVGSVNCKKCIQFGGMDRDKNVVYCRCKKWINEGLNN